MATAVINGRTVEVDADGFPLEIDLSDAPAPAPAADAPAEPITQTEGGDMAATETPAATETNGKPTTAPKSRTAKPKQSKPAKTPAVGKGGKDKPLVMFHAPKGVEKTLPVKELIRDRRVQMRASLLDESTVETYREIYQDDPDALPRIQVMEIPQPEADELGLESRYVVWDGFQRAEARQRAGLKEIPCHVSKGTWEQARALALSANYGHGLQRTRADIRRALTQLMEDETILDHVLKAAVKNGGANRALAATLRCSKGLVSKCLNDMGKSTRGDKIITLSPEDKPARKAKEVTAAMRVESKEAIKSRTTAALIHEMQFDAAAIQRRYSELLRRDDCRTLLIDVAKKAGHPVTVDDNPKPAASGKATKVTQTEYWPVADSLLSILDELKVQHEKMGVGKSN